MAVAFEDPGYGPPAGGGGGGFFAPPPGGGGGGGGGAGGFGGASSYFGPTSFGSSTPYGPRRLPGYSGMGQPGGFAGAQGAGGGGGGYGASPFGGSPQAGAGGVPSWMSGVGHPAAWQGWGGGLYSGDPSSYDSGLNPIGAHGKWSATQLQQGMIQNLIRAGLYNPLGSPAMLQALHEHALRNNDALAERANIIGHLAGLDPAQFGSYIAQTQLGLQGAMSRNLQDAQLQSMEENQQRLGAAANGLFGYNDTYKPRQPNTGVAGALGQIGGAAIGALPAFFG